MTIDEIIERLSRVLDDWDVKMVSDKLRSMEAQIRAADDLVTYCQGFDGEVAKGLCKYLETYNSTRESK